jgi:hypothetical protein
MVVCSEVRARLPVEYAKKSTLPSDRAYCQHRKRGHGAIRTAGQSSRLHRSRKLGGIQ